MIPSFQPIAPQLPDSAEPADSPLFMPARMADSLEKRHRCTGSASGLSHYATIGIGSDTPTTYNGAQQHIKKRRAHIHMHPTP